MTTMLEVMESRLGIQEMPGKKHNPIIVGWAKAIGHAEVIDDETSWCSICMCSAAKEASVPFPDHDICMMARSWLKWGMKSDDVQPGDVAIWPRGGKDSWKGHVNIVKDVRTSRNKLQVRCIGGNQGGLKGGDAVTLTGWIAADEALDFRRHVAPTVAALREAGSSEIAVTDKIKTTIKTVGTTGVVAELADKTGALDQIKDATDGLGVIQHAAEGLHAVVKFATAHFAIVALIGCVAIYFFCGDWIKQRIAKHKAGIPIFGGR